MMTLSQSSPLLWQVTVLTLFPEMFPGPLAHSLASRALKGGIWALETVDIRRFGRDKQRIVDDAPFGGGSGMVMRPDVLADAIDWTYKNIDTGPVIYFTPRGRLLDQGRVRTLVEERHVILVCGRFEGVDERVVEAREFEEISLGDFVLSGGEPAAVALIDACVRLLPGVIGKYEGLQDESFDNGLLEYPHYTRPAIWEGRAVPKTLVCGHHARIQQWRQQQSERVTQERRPDLWRRYQVDHLNRKGSR